MKPSAIIAKTLPFMLIRLAVYVAFFIGICIYTAIAVFFLGLVQKSGVMSLVVFAVFGGGGWAIYSFVREYITYMIKAAHIAVITELAMNGSIPDGFSMYKYGVEKVKAQFATANILFGLDRLVAGSVKQIQRAIGGIGAFFSFIPGVKGLTDVLNLFVDIILNYVDECIMSYIFIHKGENEWKSAADAIVLYVQNWKSVLKMGAKLLVFILVFVVIGYILFIGIFSGLFSSASGIIPIIITLIFAITLKAAILDSIVMVYMVTNFLQVSANQTPAYDLYGQIEGWSKKFTDIMGKARAASPLG
jgi:hypothetical protein